MSEAKKEQGRPQGFYQVPECLLALKARYQERGFLLTNTKVKRMERDFTIGKSWWLVHGHLSMDSLCWDWMTYTGHVKTSWLSIGRERVLLPDRDEMLTSTFLILGPLALMVARVRHP